MAATDLTSQGPAPKPGNVTPLTHLILEITNRCNLHCIHCYAESGPYEPESYGLTYEDWLSILQDASSFGCRSVQFIGGEPLLYSRLHDLIREAKNLDFETIEVYTNGTRITQRDIEVFTTYEVKVAFSYYSSLSTTHDLITGVNGSRSKTFKAIQACAAAGIHVRVGVVKMAENSDVNESFDELRAVGVKDLVIDRGRSFGRAAKAGSSPEMGELCGNCWKGSLAINSHGAISGCVFSHAWDVGELKQGLGNVLNGDALREFRDKVKAQPRSGMCDPGCGPDDGGCNPACVPGFCSPDFCNPRLK